MTYGPSEWRDQALCRNRDPELYSCDDLANNQRREYAQEVCFGCPVVRECAIDALKNGDTGIVRAGKYLPEKGGKNRRALIRLLELSDEKILPRPRRNADEWAMAKCESCSVKLRSSRSAAADYPGTRQGASFNQCQSCYRASKKGKRRMYVGSP